jgi:uncharacterized membrane protein YgcG
MPNSVKSGMLLTLSLLLFLSGTQAGAQDTRDFLLPEGIVTDFTGTLSNSELSEIRNALDSVYESNSMDGHVIIALRTEEWYIEEYVKDYADFLQGRNFIEPTGWLIYISTQDRKFGVAVQDRATGSITPQNREEIALVLATKLEQNDIGGAVLDAINVISKLPPPEFAIEKKNLSPDMLIFMGIAVIVIVLMLRLRFMKTRKSS